MQVPVNKSRSFAVATPSAIRETSAKSARQGGYHASSLALKMRADATGNASALKERWHEAVKRGASDPVGNWLRETKTLITLVLLLTLIISGVSTVYAVHMSRQLFIDLNALQNEQGMTQRRWTQLLLEKSALNAPNRVEHIATGQLGMVVPEADQIEMVK